MLTTQQLDAIEAAAKAAQADHPSPWDYGSDSYQGGMFYALFDDNADVVGDETVYRYAAKLDPVTVLALVRMARGAGDDANRD